MQQAFIYGAQYNCNHCDLSVTWGHWIRGIFWLASSQFYCRRQYEKINKDWNCKWLHYVSFHEFIDSCWLNNLTAGSRGWHRFDGCKGAGAAVHSLRGARRAAALLQPDTPVSWVHDDYMHPSSSHMSIVLNVVIDNGLKRLSNLAPLGNTLLTLCICDQVTGSINWCNLSHFFFKK